MVLTDPRLWIDHCSGLSCSVQGLANDGIAETNNITDKNALKKWDSPMDLYCLGIIYTGQLDLFYSNFVCNLPIDDELCTIFSSWCSFLKRGVGGVYASCAAMTMKI